MILPYLVVGLLAIATVIVGLVLHARRKVKDEENLEERLKNLPVDYREFIMIGPSDYFLFKGLCFVRKAALRSLGLELERLEKEIIRGILEERKEEEPSDKEDEKGYRLSELKFHCKKCNAWVRPVITLDDRLLCPSCSTEIGRITNDNKLLLRTPQFDS